MTETKPLTIEEVTSILSDIARNGEGAERFRALKMIASQETGSVTLPEPISDLEVVQRGTRLFKAMGVHAVNLCYRNAFPYAQKGIEERAAKVTFGDLEEQRHEQPVSLKQLYKKFPEIKRNGFPRGYPLAGGIEKRKDWCQSKALEILRDRKQAENDKAYAPTDSQTPTGPTP